MSIKNGYVFNKDSIEYLCKIVRNVATTSEIISDINIASNSTFSSLKIDNLIKQAIEDNNEYTDRVVSALTHLVAEKIDFEPTLDNTVDKKNTLLLYSANNNTNFNQYLRLENELLDLGTTSMDLSSYYTITQADAKFILKTEYDSLVDAIDDINDTLGNEALTTTSQTVTEAINELVKARTNMEIIDLQGESVLDFAKTFDALTYNSFYANNCYDLPNNENYGYCYVEVSQDPLYRNINFTSPTTGRKYTNTIGASTTDPTIFGEWSGWHEELIREDIVTTIDSTSTDTQVPSAKEVYDNCIKDNNLKTYTSIEQLGLTTPTTVGVIYNAIPANSCLNIFASLSSVTDLPLQQGLLSITKISTAGFDIIFKRSGSGSIADNTMYIGQLKGVDGTGLTWKKVCTTRVDNVTETNLTLTSVDKYKFTYESNNTYLVKNGICYVKFDITVVSPVSANASTSERKFCTLPKASTDTFNSVTCYNSTTLTNIYMQIGLGGYLSLWGGTAGHRYIGSFSYPVAES